MDEIEVTIVNWGKHQDIREDRKMPEQFKHHWFKCSNRIYSSFSLSSLDPAERMVWVSLLCICSQRKSGSIRFTEDWFEWETRLPKTLFNAALQKLQHNGTITVLRHNCDTTATTEKSRVEKSRVEKSRVDEKDLASNGKAVSPPMAANAPLYYPHPITGDWIAEQFGHWDEVLKIYPDQDWIASELSKMAVWLETNSHKQSKSRKGLRQRVMGWLARGWEPHVKRLPSKPKEFVLNHDELWSKSEIRTDEG